MKIIFGLSPIPGVEDKPGNKYKIRALEIIKLENGVKVRNDIPALEFINSLEKKDYRKIIAAMNLVALKGEKCPSTRFEKDADGREVYEIKTPSGLRLYCFPDKDDTMLICVNNQKKSTGGKKVQNRKFTTCFNKKKEYFKQEYGIIINS